MSAPGWHANLFSGEITEVDPLQVPCPKCEAAPAIGCQGGRPHTSRCTSARVHHRRAEIEARQQATFTAGLAKVRAALLAARTAR